MKEIIEWVRPNIFNLKPYSSARDEFDGENGVFLDANENPYGTLNRYPDPFQKKLKEQLSQINKVDAQQVFIGNGSDEIIDLLFRIFCTPQKDSVLICPPTYGMYEVSAHINDVAVIEVPLTDNFELNVDEILSKEAKIIFICSPNNPTGNSFSEIETLLQKFNGIVCIDEAYIDFSEKESFVNRINIYPNLVVSQTFSKARGLAAARVGVAYADKNIIQLMNKVKPPYNVSSLNQRAALDALLQSERCEKNIATILKEKVKLVEALEELSIVIKIFPSDANFLLVEVENAQKVYNELVDKKVIVRNRSSLVQNCIRITVGKPDENKQLITALKQIK